MMMDPLNQDLLRHTFRLTLQNLEREHQSHPVHPTSKMVRFEIKTTLVH